MFYAKKVRKISQNMIIIYEEMVFSWIFSFNVTFSHFLGRYVGKNWKERNVEKQNLALRSRW